MGSLLLPVLVFLVAGLLVLGLMVAGRRPVRTWGQGLRELREETREADRGAVRVVAEEVRLSELMTVDESSVYAGGSYEDLARAVGRTMTRVEGAAAARRATSSAR